MQKNYKGTELIKLFPTEILINIFVNLPVKELIRCREVCSRWKNIIDELQRKNLLWYDFYRDDFRDIHQLAQLNNCPFMSWYSIYKSLKLWSKLKDATETEDEFAAASHLYEEIKNFKILGNGKIGVHKHNTIQYYDINTWAESNQAPVKGDFLRYSETEDVLVTLDFRLQLQVRPKIHTNDSHSTDMRFENIKTYITAGNKVYYVNLSDDVSLCKLDNITNNFNNSFIKRCEDGIMSIAYKKYLNVLTFQRKIYSVINNNFVLQYALDANSNLLHVLREYNFLEHLDWRIYFQWMYVLNHSIPQGPLRDIVTVRTYGDVVFVGSNWGVLRIYYAPYSSGEFNIFNAEPVKQYNFMERLDCPVLSMCPIIQVDVLEKEEGHIVLIAMPKKIAVLDFTHSRNNKIIIKRSK